MLGRAIHTRAGFFCAAFLLSVIGAAQPAIAAKWYVDTTLGDLKPSEKVTPAKPAPVQVLIDFQRNGTPNPRAAKEVRSMVLDALKATGDFSEISDTPVTSGAVISIIFNDIIDKDEAAKMRSKAFGAGLTFGLGSGVVAYERYTVTLDYAPAVSAKPIEAVVHHSVVMKFGNTAEPANVIEVKTLKEAVGMMVRQSVDHGVNTIAADPGFAPAS